MQALFKPDKFSRPRLNQTSHHTAEPGPKIINPNGGECRRQVQSRDGAFGEKMEETRNEEITVEERHDAT